MIVNQGVFLVSYLFLNVTGVNSGDQKAKNYLKYKHTKKEKNHGQRPKLFAEAKPWAM